VEELELSPFGGETKDREYGRIPRRVVQLYTKACGYSFLSIFVLASVAAQLIRVLTDGWLSKWADDKTSNKVNNRVPNAMFCVQ